MNAYGVGYGIAALVGLLIMAGIFMIAAVLVWLSWKWSRPGASFLRLAFPLVLPLFAMVLCPAHTNVSIAWIGFWSAVACGILGRAVWLRPGEDRGFASIRRRKRDIVLTAVSISILYTVWVNITLADAARFRKWLDHQQQQDAEDRTKRTEEWNEGRIVTDGGSLCYSHDGRLLAVGGLDDLEIWDLTTGKLHHCFRGKLRKNSTTLQFDGDGTHLAVNVKHEVDVFDIAQKQGPITLLAGKEKSLNHVNHICFLDGQDAIVVLQDGTAHAFHIDTGQSLPLPMPALQQPDIQAFAISQDKEFQATWSPGRKQIAVWRTGESVPAWTADKIEPHYSPELQFSGDGHWLGLSAGAIVVWNTGTGVEQCRLTPKVGGGPFRFSADSRQLVAVQPGLYEPLVHIWNVSTGQAEVNYKIPVTAIGGLALDFTGRECAANVLPPTDSDRQFLKRAIQRFDTATGGEHRGFSLPQ